MGRYERRTAGLHQVERLGAEGGLVVTHHGFGERGRVPVIERAFAPGGGTVHAMAHEQMAVLEAALARVQCGFQRDRPGQVSDQGQMQLPRFAGQPLVGLGAKAVVDLERIDAACAVRVCTFARCIRRQRRVFKIEAGDLYEARCNLLPGNGLCGPAALVGHAGDQRIGGLWAVHHVAGTGDAVGQHQRKLQLR